MFWEFIIKYWLEFLFGGLCTILGLWCKSLQSKFKIKQVEQDALKEGMKAVLHDLLFQICEKYLALGYIPVQDSEEILARAKVLWKAYSGLNGNSTGETVYTRFTGLPIKNPDTP